MEIYIGQHRSVRDALNLQNVFVPPGPPGDAIWSFDLSPDTAQGTRAFFAYPGLRSHPELTRHVGNLDTELSLAQRDAINTTLGVTIAQTQLRRVFRELKLSPIHTDPTGQVRHRPLRGTRLGSRLFLGGQLIIDEPPGPIAVSATIAVFQQIYLRWRTWANLGRGTGHERRLNFIRKITGAEMLNLFGVMNDANAQRILPNPYKGDGWLPPNTEVGDNFIELGGDVALVAHTPTGPDVGSATAWLETAGTWLVRAATDDVGLTATIGSGRNVATIVPDLSTDAHRAQAEVTDAGGVTLTSVGVGARIADLNNYVFGITRDDIDPTERQVIRKRVATVETDIGSFDGEWSAGDTINLEGDASDNWTLRRNGVIIIGPTNDATLVGNLGVGLTAIGQNAGMVWNTFTGEDILVPPPPPIEQGLPEYGQRRAAIGVPSVYGGTIVRS